LVAEQYLRVNEGGRKIMTIPECNHEPAEGEIKQDLYDHGGSRIYILMPNNERKLRVDTYGGNREFSKAVFEFTKKWFTEYAERRKR